MITTGTFTAVRVCPQVVPAAPGAGPDEQPAAAAPSTAAPSTAAAAGTARAATPRWATAHPAEPPPGPGDLVNFRRPERPGSAPLIVTVAPFRDSRAPSRIRHPP